MWIPHDVDPDCFPDPTPILAACCDATAGTPGAVITSIEDDAATPRGVRIHFTSAPHRDKALVLLSALGYQTRPDPQPLWIEDTDPLLVLGWNTKLLEQRADATERVLEVVADHELRIARRALTTYRLRIREAGVTHAQAELDAAAGIEPPRTPAAEPVPQGPITFEDLDRSPDGAYELLLRILAAQRAIDKLTAGGHVQTVQDVIGLYRENCDSHGYDDDRAQAAALAEVFDSNSVALDIERWYVEEIANRR